MSQSIVLASTEARAAVSVLFDNRPPILVEVRFPGGGTSPDWHLCDEVEEFERILDGLRAGAELHVSSVWDLKNSKGAVCFRK